MYDIPTNAIRTQKYFRKKEIKTKLNGQLSIFFLFEINRYVYFHIKLLLK